MQDVRPVFNSQSSILAQKSVLILPNSIHTFEWAYFEHAKGPLIKKEIAAHDDVDLLKVDVDEFDEIAMHYEIRAMPTVIFVKNGEEIDRFVGFRQGADLTDFISKNK